MLFDVVIVGAGLAGATLGIRLAQAGQKVCILEKDSFPRDKLCGEFLSPESKAILEGTGCWQEIEKAGPKTIRYARFTASGGAELTGKLPGVGIGISRLCLDQILAQKCLELGVELLENSEAISYNRHEDSFEVWHGNLANSKKVACRRLVLAHGRRARLDRQLERRFLKQKHPYVGFKQHHRCIDEDTYQGLEEQVEIHAVPGGYCGMSHVEGGLTNVCMLLKQEVLAESGTKLTSIRSYLSQHNAYLARRLEKLRATESDLLSVSQVPFCGKAAFERGIFLVGDAAGVIAPLAGDGQAMALQSAEMLSRLFLASPDTSNHQLGSRWQRIFRRKYALRLALGRRLQEGLLKPRSANLLVGTISGVPGAFSLLSRLTRG